MAQRHVIKKLMYVHYVLVFASDNYFVLLTLCIVNFLNNHFEQDRQELSEALLVQGEMREHDRYVQEGNVFPFDANTNSQTPMNGNENTNSQAAPWRQEDEFFWGDNNLRP